MIKYRTGEPRDAAEISALLSSFQSELVDPAASSADEFLASVSTEAVRTHLASPGYSFLVAHDGKLVGVIAIRDRSHLSHFFVDRAHQRQGVGRRLWELARAKVMTGGQAGTFTVIASIKAVPVYARFGFRVTGSPMQLHGVRCVHMVAGEARGIRMHSTVLPAETIRPAMNEAAEEILRALGPAFTRTLDPHIPTGIAAAACLAGAVLRREAAAVAETCPAALGQLPDFKRRQLELMIFMEVQGPTIDPGIERGITPGAGLKGIWDGDVPPVHSPLFDAGTMIGRLGNMPELVVEKYGIPRIFGAHIPALAAMKLISSGHKLRLLDQKVGKALARCYMAAGCGTEPVPIRG
jgi:GNAT superfamily N-acetyltransferase